MRHLQIYIEKNHEFLYVGDIKGEDSSDACFSYATTYLRATDPSPISLHLPLQEKAFSPEATRCYFEGLLPEAFTRKCVAGLLCSSDEQDYLSVLAGLGDECIGAVRITEYPVSSTHPVYQHLSQTDLCDLAKGEAMQSAQLSTRAHLALAGASGKTGFYYDADSDGWYLPTGTAPSTHVVKQSHVRLQKIVANELLCLTTARYLGIDTLECSFLNPAGADDSLLFVTRRYDRPLSPDASTINGLHVPYRLHQEDFSQALGIPSSCKYEPDGGDYLRRAFALLRAHSADPIADQQKLLDLCIFNCLIGNTDGHIKNLGLLYSRDLKSVRLAPAYDIVCTMIYDSIKPRMSMSIGGESDIRKISADAFVREAAAFGIEKDFVLSRYQYMSDHILPALQKAKAKLTQNGVPGIESVYRQILEFVEKQVIR